MPERCSGTVAKWLNHKGIGFITPEGQESAEGKDILVHFSQLKQESADGFKSLQQGSTVEYDLETDPKDDAKKVAVNVTGAEGGDCEARQKGRGKKKSAKKEDGEEESDEEEDDDEDKPKKGKGKGKGRKGKGKGKGKKGKGKGKGKGKKGKGKKKDDDDEEEEEEE